MAAKAESFLSRSRNVRELDDSLKRSFTNIKNDMTALKEGVHQQGVKLAEVKQEVKDSKADFVTLDKFNITKIKIGELNENLKKVWDIEKKLEDLDRKSVSSSEFDKQNVALNNEIAKLKEDVRDISKTMSTEEQAKKLVEDINDEFDNIKKAIEELRSIKDAITKDELDKRTDKLNKQAKDVKDDFEEVKQDVKNKINAVQVEALVADINSEFDRIKEMIIGIKEGETRFARSDDLDNQIEKLDKRFKEFSEDMASALDEFSKGVERSFTDLTKASEKKHAQLAVQTDKVEDRLLKKNDDVKKQLSENVAAIRKDMKQLVTRKQAEKLVKDLNGEFDAVKGDIDSNSKNIALLSKESATRKELASEVERLKKELAKTASDIAALKKVSATKEETRGLFDELKERLSELNRAFKDGFNDLLGRMKKESDDSVKRDKQNSQDISTVEKGMRKDMKPLVHEEDLHAELDVIKGEFERLHKDLKLIKQSMLEESDLKDVNKRLKSLADSAKTDYATRKQMDRLASAVEGLQDQVDMQAELLTAKNKELKLYAKELKAAKKAEKKLFRYESVVAKAEAKAEKKAAKQAKAGKPAKAVKQKDSVPFRKSSFLASFLIGAAFVLLVIGIGFFLAGLTSLTDIMSIAAVACFVLGIIIRIVVAVKRNGGQ
ncbi:hypothetical protein KY363_02320 [Candidatus Woesearchaeota archaeon]|nr:hypothetical protein [Candidatus Woesearchaeota archaeon]